MIILHTSCSSTQTTTTEGAGDSSWVAEAQKDFEKSQKETERQLVILRTHAEGTNSFARNGRWALYRVEKQVYGVRTEKGKVTGELITEDAKIVGPWVRTYGVTRTSGGRFVMQMAISEGYTDVQ